MVCALCVFGCVVCVVDVRGVRLLVVDCCGCVVCCCVVRCVVVFVIVSVLFR